MSRSDIKAGRAYVELYLKNSALMKGLKSIRDDVQKVSNSIMGLGRNTMAVGLGIAGAFGAVALAFKSPIMAAGDLLETTSKFEAVFGKNADAMKEWAEQYARDIGRSKSDTMAAMAIFGSFFQGLDMGADKAQEFAKELHALSIDFASFHNLQDTEAQQRFISALSGSGEVLAMFGINIMQAALDQELLALGFKKSTQGATEQEKVLARISIINKSMGRQDALNDATKTAGSFSNQMKKLEGTVKDAKEAIGTALLPVITPMVTWLAKAGVAVAEWAAKNQGLIVTIAKVAAIGALIGGAIASVGALIFGAGAGIAAIGTILTGVISAVTVIGPIIAALLTPFSLLLGAIAACGAALVGIAGYWLFFTDEGRRAVNLVMSYFRPLIIFVQAVGQGMMDAIMGGNFMLALQIAGQALVAVFHESVATVAKLIAKIPQGVIDMYNALPEWMKLNLVTSAVDTGDGAIKALIANLDATAAGAQGKMLDLLGEAKDARKAAETDIKAPDLPDPIKPPEVRKAVESLKSLGSFNATQLTMQNWGIMPAAKVDKQAILEKKLDELYKVSAESGHTMKGIKEEVMKLHAMYGP